MLAFLKRLWNREPEIITVAHDELDAWYQGFAAEYLRSFDGSIQEFYGTIKRIHQELRAQREVLSSAPIHDEEQIASRVKNIVIGHRTQYCKELGIFLNNITVPDTKVGLSAQLARDLDLQMDTFAQQSLKSFRATQHLFGDDIERITKLLQELSGSVRAYQEFLYSRNVHLIEQMQKNVALLNSLRAENKRLHEERTFKQKRAEHSSRQHAQKEEEIKSLMASGAHAEYEAITGKHDKIEHAAASAAQEVTSLFAQLERALRKAEHTADNNDQKMIKQYLDEPRDALIQDSSLSIVRIFDMLSEKLPTLGIKDADKLQRLVKTQRNNMMHLRQRMITFKDEMKVTHARAEKHPYVSLLHELEYKRNHFREQEERLNKEIIQITKKVEENKTEPIVQKIQEDMQTLGVLLKIS